MATIFEDFINNGEIGEHLVIGDQTYLNETISDSFLGHGVFGTITFSGLEFENIDFSTIIFVNCIFKNCKFKKCDFTKAICHTGTFLSHNFLKVEFRIAVFDNIKIVYTKSSNNNLKERVFRSIRI